MHVGSDRPLSEAAFHTIYAQVPRLTVELVIQDGSGLVLSRRSIEPYKGYWHLPGGTVLFGESLRDAVRRVALRELGVRVQVGPLIGYIEYPLMHASGYRGWPVGMAFAATIDDGSLRANQEADMVRRFRSVPAGTIPDQERFMVEHSLCTARR